MDIQKNYKPCPIPSREQFTEKNVNQIINYKDKNIGVSHYDPFTEIEINQSYVDCEENSTFTTQSIDCVIDEKRAIFYSMRQIARDDPYYDANNSNVFYNQALFMESFEDDYKEQVSFSSYYPYYQKMGYAQLRTYFTWRTKVRGGNVTPTCAAYAFLYIYELLNNVGVANPEDGLEKLMSFWQDYRAYDTVIDRYMLLWIKDYHVYYQLNHSFSQFASDNHIKIYYPTVFGYESNQDDSFEMFARISKYNIKKSIFYTDENYQMINDCFYFILNHLRKLFNEKKRCFEDLIFYYSDKASSWVPFSRALFYPVLKQSSRQVVISERDTYSCLYNQWMYKTVILSEHGKQLIGYIMKEMEYSLRKAVNFKYMITADLNMCDKEVRRKLKDIGIPISRIIQESVLKYYALSKCQIVTVDFRNINQIRQESLCIQDKLIVSEDEDIAKKIDNDNINNVEIKVKNAVQNDVIMTPIVSNVWSEFIKNLSQIELDTLKIVLNGQDIKKFAAENRIMLEVLVDGINQKAMDDIGDTILEIEDAVSIYDEYKTKLIEMVGY